MDNDQINQQPLISGEATIDIKLGGQYDRFFWSASVLNLLSSPRLDLVHRDGGIRVYAVNAAGRACPAGAETGSA